MKCATGYEGTATPANVTCLDTGQWETVSGCAIKGKNILVRQNKYKVSEIRNKNKHDPLTNSVFFSILKNN